MEKKMELLTDINENEVLKYLGFKGGEIDEFTQNAIAEMKELIFKKADVKYTYRVFELEKEPELKLKNTVFNLEGNDIKELLKDCKVCVLMAATIGNAIDGEIRRMQIKDMAKAVILDSCASSAIENVCNNIQEMIENSNEFKNMYSTDRFSPGYGDMPLECQKTLCTVLDTQKKAGIALSRSGLMIPVKSVTAIMGFADTKQKKRGRGCEYCRMFKSCAFRKAGVTCEKN